jgi:TatD DNase family protein
MFLDSHCHLNDEKLLGNAPATIAEAESAGVQTFLVIAWDLESAQTAIALAHHYPSVYAAIGFHPENLEGISEEKIQEIKAMAADPKVKAIGEIGLDYHWYKEEKDRENQKRWFIRQIDLANELHLPVSIHAREALGDTLKILQEHPLQFGGVLHCYSGSAEMLLEFAKLGLYFGFDGPITYKNSIEPKKCVQICPLNRLLSETDSPYLSPVPHRGEINTPKNIPLIVKQMSELKALPMEDVERAIEENFARLFSVKH